MPQDAADEGQSNTTCGPKARIYSEDTTRLALLLIRDLLQKAAAASKRREA